MPGPRRSPPRRRTAGASGNPVTTTYDASATLGTETQYLVGGARLVAKSPAPSTVPSWPDTVERDFRITYALTDLVQSSTAVIDLFTGDLLETSSWLPNGARETHRTQQDESLQPEPLGFTGKEADDEVGVVHFGERYLIPRIGRWASPDPLHVHAVGGGEALNSYHYVAGNLLQSRDPVGLGVMGVVRRLIRAGGFGVGGRQITNIQFRGTRVNLTRLAESTVVDQDTIDRLRDRFRNVVVHYDQSGFADFENISTGRGPRRGHGAATYGAIGLDGARFSGNSEKDIAQAWQKMQAREGWTTSQLEGYRSQYTMHHSHVEGRMVMVDRDIQRAYRHTGGDALQRAGLYDTARSAIRYMTPIPLVAPNAFDHFDRTGEVSGQKAAFDAFTWTPPGEAMETARLATDIVNAARAAVSEVIDAAMSMRDDQGVSIDGMIQGVVDDATP